jgi:hypothetical protein
MPAEQVDAMVEAARGGVRPAPARAGREPLVRLLQEVERRPAISYLRFEKDATLVEYRRTPEEARRAAG